MKSKKSSSSSRSWLGKKQCSINWKAGKRPQYLQQGTLSTIGLAVGGTTAVIAQGSVALLRGVAAGAAAASSAGEQIQQAAAAAQSTTLTADDHAKAATQNLLLLPPVPDLPAESTRKTRSSTRSPPGITAAASDSGFCLACHTSNPSHVAHLYRGDCSRKKRPAVRSRSGTPPTTREDRAVCGYYKLQR